MVKLHKKKVIQNRKLILGMQSSHSLAVVQKSANEIAREQLLANWGNAHTCRPVGRSVGRTDGRIDRWT